MRVCRAERGELSRSVISTAKLHTLPCDDLPPIELVICQRPYLVGTTHLGSGFALRCCQRFSLRDVAIRRWPGLANRHTSGPAAPVLSYWERLPSIVLRP